MRTIAQALRVIRQLRCGDVREPILKTLGAVAREMREAQDVLAVEIGARIRHTEGVVSRFERGETVPRDLDQMVQAYADELSVDAAEIWQRTVDRWRAQEANSPEQRAVAAARRAAQPPRSQPPPDRESGQRPARKARGR